MSKTLRLLFACTFLIFIILPAILFAADYSKIKDDPAQAASYLSGYLDNAGGKTFFNKYIDPYSSDIPDGVKDAYKLSIYWNPATFTEYVQCTSFVNEAYLWQYPYFPVIRGDALTYLDNVTQRNGFTVFRSGATKEKPQRGDILVWNYPPNGHVAVVSSLTEHFTLVKVGGQLKREEIWAEVNYYQGNSPKKEESRHFYYDDEKYVVFGQNNPTVPIGWIHWDRATFLKNEILSAPFICRDLAKKDRSYWEKLTGSFQEMLVKIFRYDCRIIDVDPQLLDKQMSSLGGNSENTQKADLKEQIAQAQKIFENYQKTVNDLSLQFQDKTLIMDSQRLEEELVKIDKLIKALESYLDQLSRLFSLATGTTTANYQKLLLDFISQARELTELVKSAYSLLAFQKDYLRDFEQLRSQVNTVSQKLSKNESTVNELSQLVSKAIEKEDQLIKRLREQNVRPELKKMVDIEIRGLTEERQLLLDFNTALDNQDVDFLLSFGQKYNDFLQRFITEAPTGMDDFNQSASKIIQSLSAISTQIAAEQSTLIGR